MSEKSPTQEEYKAQVIAGKWRWEFPIKSGSVKVTKVYAGTGSKV
jgi:hypothetical protein